MCNNKSLDHILCCLYSYEIVFFFHLVEIFYCIICFCLFYWVLTFMVFIYYSFFFVLGLVFTTSRFGKPVVIFGNYRFNKYYKCVGPKARWACTRRNCRAVLITIDDTLVAHKDCHNHPWTLFTVNILPWKSHVN